METNDRNFHHCGLQSCISVDICGKKIVKIPVGSVKGKNYCMTCLGFGINVEPKVMATILKTVLEKMDSTENAVVSHIDDILVDETAVPVQNVMEHLDRRTT